MKSFIAGSFTDSLKINKDTEIGRAWEHALGQSDTADKALTEQLTAYPELLALYLQMKDALEKAATYESLCFADAGFRRGFFLAAELYGEQGLCHDASIQKFGGTEGDEPE